MKNLFRCVVAVAAFAWSAVPATAQELKLSMANGRVTLVAQDVTIRQILAEWARVGETRIVNGDKLMGPPLSLQLVDYPEGRALDILLREAAGYVTAPRPANQPGASVYDRIMILATSKAPPPTAAAAVTPPPYRNMNVLPPQSIPAQTDDQDDPVDQGAVPQPGSVPQAMPQGMPMPGVPTGAQPYPMGVQQQPVMTSPRPGQLPPPPAPAGMNPYAPPPNAAPGPNPYAPQPGTVRQPGVQPRPGGGTPDTN